MLVMALPTSAIAAYTLAQVLPMSGPLANVGKEIHAATKAYIEVVNNSGGVNGLPIKLVLRDDANNAEKASAAVNELVAAEAPLAFVSCFGTVSCNGQVSALKAKKAALLGTMAGAPAFRDAKLPHIFALRPSASQEVQKLLGYAQAFAVEQVAVYVQDDGFGRSYLPVAQGQLKQQFPLNTAPVLVLNPAKPDYTQLAQDFIDSKATTVMMLANATHSGEFIKALRARSAYPLALNLAGQANAAFVKSLAGSNAKNVFVTMTPSPATSSLPLAVEYRNTLKAFDPSLPLSYLSFEAYVNAKLAVAALRESKAKNPDELVKLLNSGRSFELGGYAVRFTNTDRQGSNYADLSLLRDNGTFMH